MKQRFFYFVAFFAFAMCFCAMSSQAQAQATRTWVSGTGDDVNPCSRTAPCKTFAGAISKTADCGEIDALDPAGYGAVTLTKGIKIDGGGGEAGQVASILPSAGAPGVVINNSSATCKFNVLRNLDINGVQSGSIGVNVLQGKNVSLENVDIENLTGQCINFQPAAAMNLVIYNVNLENCTTGGVVSSTSAGATNHINIEKSTIHRMGNGIGVRTLANTATNIHNSMISNNNGGGVSADTATSNVTVDLSTIANNQVFGVHAAGGGAVRLANNSITNNNGTGLLADPGSFIFTWSNNWVHNNAPDGARTGTVTPM